GWREAQSNWVIIPSARQVLAGSAYGIRTRVPALRGLCPRPLDERAVGKQGRDDTVASLLRNGNLPWPRGRAYSFGTVGAMSVCVSAANCVLRRVSRSGAMPRSM